MPLLVAEEFKRWFDEVIGFVGRIVFFAFAVGIRRCGVFTAEVTVAVVVDEEDNSSGSVEFGTDDDEEVVKDFDVSSASFSVEIRRETAQR